MWKASNGNTRVDTPQTSVIADVAGKRTILLDHVKKEATVIPTPPAPAAAPPAGAPKPGGAAPPPPLQVHDLGKGMIEGHEVEGKKFVFSPPAPKMPAAPAPLQMPKMPQAPQPPKAPGAPAPGAPPAPQMPKMPALAQPPKPPQPPAPPKPPQPTVTEVWTSTKLKTPVLTKVTSGSGEHTTYCKPVSTEEPHPSLFQIPPGYKVKS
jgi:hypothetical protein